MMILLNDRSSSISRHRDSVRSAFLMLYPLMQPDRLISAWRSIAA